MYSLLPPTLLNLALATPPLGQSLFSSGCPATGPISCQDTGGTTGSCCYESPGGLLLQTQFWDTRPSTGPVDSWTIHGLWPDDCNTALAENCDPSRAYTDIGDLLSNNGASDTLAFMQEFWVDVHGKNERFWEHEWATHGTCLSTLDPTECFPANSVQGAETVVRLFQTLPTFNFLSKAGITPSSSTTYTLDEFNSALEAGSGGFTPELRCSGRTVNAIYWFFNLKGSVIDGTFIPINAPRAGNCPEEGLRYPPKSE